MVDLGGTWQARSNLSINIGPSLKLLHITEGSPLQVVLIRSFAPIFPFSGMEF